jgi:hypothetical protein
MAAGGGWRRRRGALRRRARPPKTGRDAVERLCSGALDPDSPVQRLGFLFARCPVDRRRW